MSRKVNLGRKVSKMVELLGVSSGSSTRPGAGEVLHAALARHQYPGRSECKSKKSSYAFNVVAWGMNLNNEEGQLIITFIYVKLDLTFVTTTF